MLKEIYRLLDRGVVVVPPEVLHTLNLRAKLFQGSLIRAIFLLVLLLSKRSLKSCTLRRIVSWLEESRFGVAIAYLSK